jgi:hypothetical protein
MYQYPQVQNSIMEGLIEHGYTGILDPRSKVRYLLDGIETDKFDSVKTQIMSDATLRSDFDACVTLKQDYIKQTSKSKTPSTVGISEVGTSTGGNLRKSKTSKTAISPRRNTTPYTLMPNKNSHRRASNSAINPAPTTDKSQRVQRRILNQRTPTPRLLRA